MEKVKENPNQPFPSPGRAVYGFVLYLASYVLLVLFLVWAYVPDEWLFSIGLTYLPKKYWAVAAPVYLCVAGCFILFIYCIHNLIITKPLDSINTIVDKHSTEVSLEGLPPGAIPPIGDLSITEVNRRLYSHTRQEGVLELQ